MTERYSAASRTNHYHSPTFISRALACPSSSPVLSSSSSSHSSLQPLVFSRLLSQNDSLCCSLLQHPRWSRVTPHAQHRCIFFSHSLFHILVCNPTSIQSQISMQPVFHCDLLPVDQDIGYRFTKKNMKNHDSLSIMAVEYTSLES